jgi:hypothetical protein
VHPDPLPPRSTAVGLRLECTLRLRSLAPRGTSGERVGVRGKPIKPSSSPRPSPPPSSEEREKTACVLDADFLNSTAVHPGPLPHEERRCSTLHSLPVSVLVGACLRFVPEAVRPPNAILSAIRERTIHPLLGGEGRGEGERSPGLSFSAFVEYSRAIRQGRCILQRQLRPLWISRALAPAP